MTVVDILLVASMFGLDQYAEAALSASDDLKVPGLAERMAPEVLAGLRERVRLADCNIQGMLWNLANALLDRSAQKPREPGDWIIQFTTSCDCRNCHELKTFCRDPKAQTHYFRVARGQREHIHDNIDLKGLDISYRTERGRRPYTLVCTKNRASYHRRMDEYARVISIMNERITVLPDTCSDEDRIERLRLAIANAD